MKEKIKQNENEINIIEKKLNIYNILETVLGDHGIKEKILSLYIPLLNHEIKKYLNIMNINYDLEIDDEFNTKLTILGDECELTSLSTGELKKVDFAVLLSILKIIQIKQSNLNILMLDEIFSSIDGTGQNDIIEILKDISKIYNLNIYVISHYPLPTAEFDNVIHVTKDGDYSKFEFEKI
jgi:DNA repair exonuclease SbcCD ATPase subunit